jgi:hypothetical protein
MARRTGPRNRLRMYDQLLAVNAGFEQARRALKKLGNLGWFDRAELAHLSALSEEARAASNCLVSVIETLETAHAGKLYRRRLVASANKNPGSAFCIGVAQAIDFSSVHRDAATAPGMRQPDPPLMVGPRRTERL